MSKLDDAEIEVEGWRESRQLVMTELRRIGRTVESLDAKVGGEMTDMKVEIATIKVKVAAIVFVATTIVSALVSLLFNYLSRR